MVQENIAFIFARGGSKGLPGKNIRQLGDHPLLGWSIIQAKAVPSISRVIVSTDSPQIAEVARHYEADVPFMRPSELAGDQSSEWHAWQHALRFYENETGRLPSAMISVPPTAPLRSPDDIVRCLKKYYEEQSDVVITVTDAHRNPYFNMVTKSEDGTFRVLLQPDGAVVRRQDAPEVYDVATVAYVANPRFVLMSDSAFAGRTHAVHVPLERAVDIDTPLDFLFAEFLLQKAHGKNS